MLEDATFPLYRRMNQYYRDLTPHRLDTFFYLLDIFFALTVFAHQRVGNRWVANGYKREGGRTLTGIRTS